MSYVKQIDEDHIVTFKDETDYLSCRLDYLNQYGENSNLSFSFFVEQTFRHLHPERIENVHHIDHNDPTNNPVVPIDCWEPMSHNSYGFTSSVVSVEPSIDNPVYTSYNVDWAAENSQSQTVWTGVDFNSGQFVTAGDYAQNMAENYMGYASDNPCGEVPLSGEEEDIFKKWKDLLWKDEEKKKQEPLNKNRFELMDLEE